MPTQRPQEAAPARKGLAADQLAILCDPATFQFASTQEVAPLEQGIIGQTRAIRAMEFGLRVRHAGYNIFLTGPAGTGKTTYARTRVHQIAESQTTPSDWCYVYNFRHPDQPLCICLPSGGGVRFRQDMEELVDDLKSEIRRAFDGEEWERRRGELVDRFEKTINEKWEGLEELARSHGFAIQRAPTGILTIPLNEGGQPITPEEFNALPEPDRETLADRSRTIQGQVAETIRRVRNLEKDARAGLKQLERETALFAMGHLISQVKERYTEHPRVAEYLDQVQQDVVEHFDEFRNDGEEESPMPGLPVRPAQKKRLHRYKMNLFVDNSASRGAPVIFESNPTYFNLFGKVEYRSDFGSLVTDFTMIKPGAIHQANGGYLALQAVDLFANPMAWAALKRTLKTGQVRIESLGDQLGLTATTSLKPEPMPVQVKILLIGHPYMYQLLYTYDDDFRKLFKVKADFDVEMVRTPEHMQLYASFVSGFCSREGLCHLDPSAMARLVDFSTRLAENQGKLSTRFHEVTEVIFEAASWAGQEGAETVSATHVERALEERIYRSNRIEEKILEMIAEGTLLVDTDGQAVGQVNGLAVLDLGDYAFGKPSRITARAAMGEKGIVNIERETEMSGPIHSKGVFILGAYLAGMFAQDKPLALSASICFEQLYEDVEGDSASSAELYALLSELAGVPVVQGIAVTGSVNQKGEIQPVGGVNEKIEGFYHVCKARGLTGRQGVLIPVQNTRHLMLKEEVRAAVARGAFHIYTARTVQEGIEILTGVPAGERQEDGAFPEGTINFLVDDHLHALAEAMRQFGHDGHDGHDGQDGDEEEEAS